MSTLNSEKSSKDQNDIESFRQSKQKETFTQQNLNN